MIGATLAMLLVLGQGPSSSPTALVEQLGSPRFAERERATEELAQLGAEALPVLRAALDAKDPEVRARAAILVEKTEALLLTQPTLVTLDIKDRPLTEAVAIIGEQAGIKLTLMPENSPAWRTSVTLVESSPLPFWKALDRLCVAGNLKYNLGMQGSSRNREPRLTLSAGREANSLPTSDLGPFRVQLTNLNFQRSLAFAAGPRPIEQFYMQVQVVAEPRLWVSQGGQIQIHEAEDDRGQSLMPPGGGTTTRQSGYFGMSSGAVVQMQAHLKRPAHPGAKIKKLRGSVPIGVATRKPDPLVVPLAVASGKTFRNDQVSLTVQEVQPNPIANQFQFDLVVRPQGGPGTATPTIGDDGGQFSLPRHDLHQQQIELLDAKGEIMQWYPRNLDPEGARISMTVAVPDGVAVPTELRYYSLARAATEVQFEFTDVILP